MRSDKANLWIELGLWLTLALGAFLVTFDFAHEISTYAWGPASWPRAIILLIALGAVFQFVVRRRARALSEETQPKAFENVREAGLASTLRLIGALGLPLLYAYVLPKAGFYLITPFFLAAYLAILGELRWKFLVGIPLVIYAMLNLIFTVLFFVPLPVGYWPGFYEFSNWFLVLVR